MRSILFTKSSRRKFDRLSFRMKMKVKEVLVKFKNDEKIDIVKMKGKKDEYRIRVGDYRIILKKVMGNDYLVMEIDTRNNIYGIFGF